MKRMMVMKMVKMVKMVKTMKMMKQKQQPVELVFVSQHSQLPKPAPHAIKICVPRHDSHP